MRIFTAAGFNKLSARSKGYAVYMMGSREDQPDIPEEYEPSPKDKEEYERGQFAAMLEAQDSP